MRRFWGSVRSGLRRRNKASAGLPSRALPACLCFSEYFLSVRSAAVTTLFSGSSAYFILIVCKWQEIARVFAVSHAVTTKALERYGVILRECWI